MKIIKNEKGYTLIELLMVFAITAIILPVLYFTLGNLDKDFSIGADKQELVNSARVTMNRIVTETRLANGASTSNPNQLQLEYSKPNSPSNSVDSTQLIYLNGDKLYLRDKDGNVSILADQVSSFSVKYPSENPLDPADSGLNVVTVNIKMADGFSLQNAIYIRNDKELGGK